MRDDAEPAGEERSPFGYLLREFRIAAKLSQEALAERAALSADGISVLERGMRRAPHRETVALLAAALGLSASERERLQTAAVSVPIPRRREPRAAPGDLPGVHNLPLSLTSFHGREEESKALQARLFEARLVTLTGTGGVGKTRLALETARAVAERFPDGVWCVELAPLSGPELVAERIAAVLGVTTRSPEVALDAAWIAKLARKRLLLVLDNCEHVLDAAATLAQQILERCRDVRVLATSREALRVGGESVMRVDPLRVPALHPGHAPSRGDLQASPAIKLFLDRARLVAPTLKLGDDAAAWQTVASICSRLDGLPLAIELAAGRMNAMTLDTLSRALDGRLVVLTNGARTALPRHQTLHALIDWSYDLLGETERRVFRRLAVFSGGWTLESALAVFAEDATSEHELLAILCSLVDKSLIVGHPVAAGLRYGTLETVRAYILHRLTDAGERQSTARRHAEYFCDLVRRNNATWGTVPMAAWMSPLEREVDNLRAALQWSLVEQHDVALGSAIAAGQSRVFEQLSLAQEGRRWCERALAALTPNALPLLEASLRLALAKFCVHEAHLEKVVEAAMHSARLFETLPEPLQRANGASSWRALALAYAGFALGGQRRNDEAYTAAAQALTLARSQSDLGVLAWALIVKSCCSSDSETRLALAGEALAVARSMPAGYSFEGLAFVAFSLAKFDASDLEGALSDALAATDSLRSSGLHDDTAVWALAIAATCAILTGDLDGAVAYARDGLSLSEGGASCLMADLMQVIANALIARGKGSDSARLTGACEALYAATATLRGNYAQTLYDRTIALLGLTTSPVKAEVWRAEGRNWSLAESVAAALDLERRSRTSASESYG